jgi:GntR family transcriptional regulator, transcriptional repressor for pyruvate dehydrogenase complex
MSGNEQGFTLAIERGKKQSDIPTMVAEYIVSMISSEQLKPGDKLPSELEMTRRFGISRISLREAMKLLDARGYIECRGRKGKYIRSFTEGAVATPLEDFITSDNAKLSQLFEVKRILDGEQAFMAATRASDADISSLMGVLAEVEQCIRSDSPDCENLVLKRYKDFFLIMSESTQNTIFSHLTASMSATLKHILFGNINGPADHRGRCGIIRDQLSSIVSAIAVHSPLDARDAAHRHIDFLRKAQCA